MISANSERHFLNGCIVGVVLSIIAWVVVTKPGSTKPAGDCTPQDYVIARDPERGNCMYIVDKATGDQIQIGNTGGSQWCGRK